MSDTLRGGTCCCYDGDTSRCPLHQTEEQIAQLQAAPPAADDDCPDCVHCEYPQRDSAECRLNTLKPAGDRRRLPIDRPCSACSAGDVEMKHHLHGPPFREGVADGLTPEQIAQQWADTYHISGSVGITTIILSAIREALASRDRELTVKCGDCGSGIVWTRDGQQVTTMHDCRDGKAGRERFEQQERELAELRAHADKLNHAVGHINMLILKAYKSGSIQGSVEALNGIRAILAANITGTPFCPAESQLAAPEHRIMLKLVQESLAQQKAYTELSKYQLAAAKQERNQYDSAHKREAANVLRLNGQLAAAHEALRAHVYRLNDAGLQQFRDDANAILTGMSAPPVRCAG